MKADRLQAAEATAPPPSTGGPGSPRIVMIVLPFPPFILSPNARKHWKAKMEPAGSYKYDCMIAALNVRRRLELQGFAFPMGPVPVKAHITFILTSRRRRDWDNLLSAFKYGIDGIVAAGLLEDDNISVLSLDLAAEFGTEQLVRVWLEAAT